MVRGVQRGRRRRKNIPTGFLCPNHENLECVGDIFSPPAVLSLKRRQRLGAAAWEMLSLSTYAIGDLSMAFVLEGYFVGKF